jgi:hypothetical protein
MSAFQDCLGADLGTFLNPDEFGKVHDVDGQHVTCIFDSDIYEDLKYSAQRELFGGIYVSTKVLFVKAADLPDRPVKGQHIRIDGELYLVTECAENAGMLEIILEANDA